jgi:hypothetical protein
MRDLLLYFLKTLSILSQKKKFFTLSFVPGMLASIPTSRMGAAFMCCMFVPALRHYPDYAHMRDLSLYFLKTLSILSQKKKFFYFVICLWDARLYTDFAHGRGFYVL